MPPETDPSARAESRGAVRRRSLFPGRIISRDGSFSSECLIRDFNEAGAKIDLPPERLFPLRLYLIAARLPSAFDAEVIWRNGRQAGLIFHRALDLAEGDNPAPQFLRRLHSELCPRESRGF
jgi:hypothetical protein